MNIIAAILVFGLIVLVHEFGHFLLAKLNGVGVVEFSIGMGPRLWSIEKGETRYSLKCLPFGGSCMMVGEDEDDGGKNPKAFNNKSVWARISVIAAGPIFNLILAFGFAMVFITMAGYDAPLVYEVVEGSPAAESGLQSGDILTEINGTPVATYRDVDLYLVGHRGETWDMNYIRSNSGSYEDWSQGYTEGTVSVTPEYSEADGAYMMGIRFGMLRQKTEGLGELLRYSAYEIRYCLRSTVESLRLIFQRKIEVESAVAGPVRIVAMIGDNVAESREYGWESVVLSLSYWCILMSASLGIMNLLPIPALDGGRLLFLIIEVIRRKPMDQEKEGMVHMAGMALLMSLMVLVLFNDIMSFF
ncbi:MAG: M50 family metallopeptidase [Lachnospiraceae bacterium]